MIERLRRDIPFARGNQHCAPTGPSRRLDGARKACTVIGAVVGLAIPEARIADREGGGGRRVRAHIELLIRQLHPIEGPATYGDRIMPWSDKLGQRSLGNIVVQAVVCPGWDRVE